MRWEEATAAATHAGIRTVLLRFGLVLNADGGVLKNLVMPGGLAVVGSLGNGSHKMSWISLTDAIEGHDGLPTEQQLRRPSQRRRT